jgi:hypothetical protein
MNKSDTEKTVCGVPGRLTHATTKPGRAPGLWFKQRWISESRLISGYGLGARIRVEIRFDDELGNGHNSFAVTGDIYKIVPTSRGVRQHVDIAGGCLHENIARVFPELAHLIRWHLFDHTGPMHYIANVVYFAGDRDCWGCRKGEPRSYKTTIQFGDNPIKHTLPSGFIKFLQEHRPLFGHEPYDFEVLPLYHADLKPEPTYKFGPKYTFGGYGERWHEGPFDTEQEALDFLYALNHCQPKFIRAPDSFGEGKARELDSARRAAVWHDATDEELSVDRDELKAKLLARLPALVAAFCTDIEAAGFDWQPSEQVTA